MIAVHQCIREYLKTDHIGTEQLRVPDKSTHVMGSSLRTLYKKDKHSFVSSNWLQYAQLANISYHYPGFG